MLTSDDTESVVRPEEEVSWRDHVTSGSSAIWTILEAVLAVIVVLVFSRDAGLLDGVAGILGLSFLGIRRALRRRRERREFQGQNEDDPLLPWNRRDFGRDFAKDLVGASIHVIPVVLLYETAMAYLEAGHPAGYPVLAALGVSLLTPTLLLGEAGQRLRLFYSGLRGIKSAPPLDQAAVGPSDLAELVPGSDA